MSKFKDTMDILVRLSAVVLLVVTSIFIIYLCSGKIDINLNVACSHDVNGVRILTNTKNYGSAGSLVETDIYPK